MYSNEKGLRRHINADISTDTKLRIAEHATQSGICSVCTMCGECEIGKKAKMGHTLFPEPFSEQFGGEKRLPNIGDLQIIPELYGEEIRFETVKTETKFGGFKASLPIAVAAMGSTKVAHTRGTDLAIGAAKSGIPMVIGENMLATHGKKGMKERIEPYLDNYKKIGAVIQQGNCVDIKNKTFEIACELGCHGIEVKFGQGAKQGLGGEIKFESKQDAEKYKKMGYYIVKNPDNTYQRHAPPGSLTEKELRTTLIKYSELDLPIWIKIGMGRGIIKLINSISKINKEQKTNVKALTIDGYGGGTGMSPWLVMNEMNIPSAAVMQNIKKKIGFDIILAGGYTDGFDIAKGMMLGANGISIGRAFLIATNTNKEQGVINYVNALKTELQMVSGVLRKKTVEGVVGKRQNLISLDENSRKMFGITNESSKII